MLTLGWRCLPATAAPLASLPFADANLQACVANAAAMTDQTYLTIEGARHYYQGQPEHLQRAVDRATPGGSAWP